MNWKLVTELAIRWAVPAALSAIAGAIGGAIVSAFARRKTKKEQEAAQNTAQNIHIATGVQCLLRADIIRSAEKYHDKGFCPIYARESLTREYNSYHNLGGNDVATELFHRTISLPTDPEKEVHSNG